MNKIYNLCDLSVGERGTVISVSDKNPIKRRLLDIGLIDGTRVCCTMQSPGKDMNAYLIRGAVMAIRNCDCVGIFITKEGSENGIN